MPSREIYFQLKIIHLARKSCSYSVTVKWHTSIKDLKDKLHQLSNIPPSHQLLFHGQSVVSLPNTAIINDLGFDAGSGVLYLISNQSSSLAFISPIESHLNEECSFLLSQVQQGLEAGYHPKVSDIFEGTGGVYFMKSDLEGHTGNPQTVAVFKPRDEEQGMKNNPKNFQGQGYENDALRVGFSPGQGYYREVAAYEMDVDGFCSVPPTLLVECRHPSFQYWTSARKQQPKLGSLQRFIPSVGCLEDFGKNQFSVLQIQKIALFDMRVLNSDRHAGNILVSRAPCCRRNYRSDSVSSESSDCSNSVNSVSSSPSYSSYGSSPSLSYLACKDYLDLNFDTNNPLSSNNSIWDYHLVPIDHGYCFPNQLEIQDYQWCWLSYPQVHQPIHPSIQSYFQSLNIDDCIQRLRRNSSLQLSPESIRLIRVVHHLISLGMERGLTLAEIAHLIVRVNEEEPSFLELLMKKVEYNSQRWASLTSYRSNITNSRFFTGFPEIENSCVEQKENGLYFSGGGSIAGQPIRPLHSLMSPSLIFPLVNSTSSSLSITTTPTTSSSCSTSPNGSLFGTSPLSPLRKNDYPLSPLGYYEDPLQSEPSNVSNHPYLAQASLSQVEDSSMPQGSTVTSIAHCSVSEVDQTDTPTTTTTSSSPSDITDSDRDDLSLTKESQELVLENLEVDSSSKCSSSLFDNSLPSFHPSFSCSQQLGSTSRISTGGPCGPPALTRITSFAAFSSSPILRRSDMKGMTMMMAADSSNIPESCQLWEYERKFQELSLAEIRYGLSRLFPGSAGASITAGTLSSLT